MSAARLREAAAEIRLEWAGDRGGAWSRTQDFHLEVADWLMDVAARATLSATLVAKDDIGYAHTVANAYLGSDQ